MSAGSQGQPGAAAGALSSAFGLAVWEQAGDSVETRGKGASVYHSEASSVWS